MSAAVIMAIMWSSKLQLSRHYRRWKSVKTDATDFFPPQLNYRSLRRLVIE